MRDYDETRDYNFWELSGDFDLYGNGQLLLNALSHLAEQRI